LGRAGGLYEVRLGLAAGLLDEPFPLKALDPEEGPDRGDLLAGGLELAGLDPAHRAARGTQCRADLVAVLLPILAQALQLEPDAAGVDAGLLFRHRVLLACCNAA